MSFISDLFSTGSTQTAGGSLIGDVGDLGLGLVQNRGKQIEGQYKVELQQLLNDNTKTKGQVDAELGRLNAERDAKLGEIKTEQTKLYLAYGLGALVVVGLVVGLIAWLKDT